MNEMQLRQQVVDIISKWIGGAKGSAAHHEILTTYNSHMPLAVGYAVQPWDDYCDATVSAAYIKAGMAEFTGTECGVERHTKLAKQLGIWVENDDHIPEIGDSCVYDWQAPAQGDATGWADHIGIVTSVSADRRSFTVTEGNMAGGVVGKHEIPVGYRYIRGFICPNFKAAAAALSGAAEPVGDRAKTKKRFGFDDNTMAYLDKHPFPDALYQKLANKE